MLQEVEATVINGNGAETGHIIVTTIGGRGGQRKQVDAASFSFIIVQLLRLLKLMMVAFNLCEWQTISYMAERVIGQGSFGVVFQVCLLVSGG